jgi:hypothetical protein
VLAGAVLMPASLFFSWYHLKERAGGRDFSAYSLSGWEAFESTDTLLVLAAIAIVAVVVLRLRFAGTTLLCLGALTAGWIVVQLIDGPVAFSFLDRSDYALRIGALLGLLGAVLTLGAGALTLRRTGA